MGHLASSAYLSHHGFTSIAEAIAKFNYGIGTGTLVLTWPRCGRVVGHPLAQIDERVAKQDDVPSRPGAIRRLVNKEMSGK